jgi:hypothetical protein
MTLRGFLGSLKERARRGKDQLAAKAQRSPRDVEINKEWRLIESRNTGSKDVLKTLAL